MKRISENMKEHFIAFFTPYSSDKQYPEQLWQKIEQAYSSADRHYHTLEHLAKMLETISLYESKLNDKEALVLALWFHDLVYDTKRNDNEEKSAVYLKNESAHFTFPEATLQKALELILLTQKHILPHDSDFDRKIFLDADLIILGGTEEEYRTYQEGVRKEYGQYPDFLYKEGRKKVLEHFFESSPLYKTTGIRDRFEERAKINLSLELKQLSV